MPNSMTGFASATGEYETFSWSWDIRSVNARGLDIRLRMPDWLDGLEEAVRKAVKARFARGSVSVALKLTRRDDAGTPEINAEGLARVLNHLTAIAAEAEVQGLSVAPVSASDIAQMRGVLEVQAPSDTDNGPLVKAIAAQLPALLDDFAAARAQEGAALGDVLSAQVDEIAQLTEQSESLMAARDAAQTETLRRALARVMDNADGADPDRVSQELAVLAVKTDVREELDRLKAHVTTARSHLAETGAIGRKFDFLTQEFNREANTLCSKAQFKELTAIGLDLKHVIDQMREQVQNVE